jgi:hypothetical protein
MPYKVERLSGEPVIIVTWQGPFSEKSIVEKDFIAACDDVVSLMGSERPVVRIDDVRGVKVDFGDLVVGMGVARKKLPGSPSDPSIKALIVGSGFLWDLASKGAKQLQYGAIDIPLFTSMEDALATARKIIR